jgi:tetratricopeptide (TPR) repeat protein
MRQVREVNSADQSYRLSIALWSFVGGGLGTFVGFVVASAAGWSVVAGSLSGCVLGFFGMYFGISMLAQLAASSVGSAVWPSGATTPREFEYSLGESLVARGRYEDARTEYLRNVEENPDNPELCLRVARLHRDHLKDYEGSVAWFRRAITLASNEGTEYLAVRELVEFVVMKVDDPKRAFPDLARFAARYHGTERGEWAARYLSEVKGMIPPEEWIVPR